LKLFNTNRPYPDFTAAHGEARPETFEKTVDSLGLAEKSAIDLRRLKSLGNLKFLNGKQRGNDWTKGIPTMKSGTERRVSPTAGREVTETLLQEELQYGILPVRFITTISTQTNMKYMKLGDEAIAQLFEALEGDPVINNLYLSSARMTCLSALNLAQVIPTMSALISLDLSNNCIADDGAVAIAQAIERLSAYQTKPQQITPNTYDHDQAQPSLENNSPSATISKGTCSPSTGVNLTKVNLAGNRITVIGAEALITAALAPSSPMQFLR
jgi:hypothetical protein